MTTWKEWTQDGSDCCTATLRTAELPVCSAQIIPSSEKFLGIRTQVFEKVNLRLKIPTLEAIFATFYDVSEVNWGAAQYVWLVVGATIDECFTTSWDLSIKALLASQNKYYVAGIQSLHLGYWNTN